MPYIQQAKDLWVFTALNINKQNMEHLKIQEMPEYTIKALKEAFERRIEVRMLRNKSFALKQKGLYQQALTIEREIENLYQQCLATYMQDLEDELSDYNDKKEQIPFNDIKEIIHLIVTANMAIDILDSCIIDANDILKKTDKSLSLGMFNDISQLAAMAKHQMSLLSNTTKLLDHPVWGDVVDNMYMMMQNKAKAILRKTAEKDNDIFKGKINK